MNENIENQKSPTQDENKDNGHAETKAGSASNEQKNTRKYKLEPARNIHQSSVLPPREHSAELSESVKRMGILQPLIVRPIASRPGHYESIDGGGRLNASDPEQEVPIDVREVSDADVFKISEATSKRTQRNTYENALFYSAYLQATSKENGGEGAQKRVAQEAQITESLLSQYLTIDALFKELKKLCPSCEFGKLKNLGINKLYALCSIIDKPKLLASALLVEENADSISIEEVRDLVEEKRKTEATSLEPTATANNPAEIEPAPDTTASPDTAIGAVQNASTVPKEPGERLGKALENLSSMIKQLNENVSRISNRELPSSEESTAETTKTIAKLCSTVRKLAYYVKKLENLFVREDGRST